MEQSRQKGFSLVELLIALAILAIMSGIAIPNLIKYYKDYKFTDYASQMEYLVKFGKIYAMEKTKNVGFCVSGNTFSVRDITTSRGADKCSGSAVKTMTVSEGYITLAGYGALGLGPTVDPRGLAIYTGSVCVTYNNKYVRMCINKTGVRKEEGTGGCSACSS